MPGEDLTSRKDETALPPSVSMLKDVMEKDTWDLMVHFFANHRDLLRVHVYDKIPAEASQHYQISKWSQKCENSMFGSEIFIPHLVKTSPYHEPKPEKADLILVELYSTCGGRGINHEDAAHFFANKT